MENEDEHEITVPGESEYEGPPEADIPSMPGETEEDEERVKCPRSGKPHSMSMKAYEFAGYPELTCWKEIAKREISAEEFVDALKAAEGEGKPAMLEGFVSKEGKKFSAGLQLNEEEDGFTFYFPPAEESSHLCPKSKEPIKIHDKVYRFPGYEGYAFFRTICKRVMSVTDYIDVVNGPAEGVEFTGFVSKGGKKFDAKIVLDHTEKKAKFADFKKKPAA